MSNPAHSAGRHLVALGFTEIEAAAYTFLLGEAPATGYRVAQAIGRTTANTYKALESLEERGAVMAEAGETKLYRPVRPDELLKAIEADFTKHRKRAASLLERITTDVGDDRVYQLRTPSQVYERARAILDGARHVVLLDAFTMPLAEIREAIESAASRGVKIAMLVYEPVVIKSVDVVVNHQAAKVRKRWPAQWINLAADASQQVHALMTPDGSEVLHATWSASAFLAHLYQSGLLGELTASVVRNAIRNRQSTAAIGKALARLDRFEHADTPAFARLSRGTER